ncbi:hypothetical protein MMC21_007836 [Puttea exsequens]|nr:hypothetical protein [Puttea exsequens]
MFNDALIGDDGWFNMINTHANYQLGDKANTNDQGMNRQNVFVARYSEALATVARGDVIFVVGNRVNQVPGSLPGAYQSPLAEDVIPNAWRFYEFPTLQRNQNVRTVTTYDAGNQFAQVIDWTLGGANPNGMLPPSIASTVDIPPVAGNAKLRKKRDNPACSLPASSVQSSGPAALAPTTALLAPTTAPLVPTTAPTRQTATSGPVTGPMTTSPPPVDPLCYLQYEDPDQGIDTEYCVCGATTLPLLTVASPTDNAQSCGYTSLPASKAIHPTNGFGAPVTYRGQCQVCTPIGPFAQNCQPMANCYPEAAAATVQVGSSPVHVGTLTGTALYTAVSSALDDLCPPVSQTTSMTTCSTDSAIIPGIDYESLGFLDHGGELVVKVQSSAYNQTSLRNAMINSAALTAQNSANGTNCYEATYDVEIGFKDKRDPEPQPWYSSGAWGDNVRRWVSPSNTNSLEERDHPYPEIEHATWCNAASFAGVQYYDEYWREAPQPGPSDYIDASWSFSTGPGGDFACDFIQDLILGLTALAPEFEVEGVELAHEVDALCTDAMDIVNQFSGGGGG